MTKESAAEPSATKRRTDAQRKRKHYFLNTFSVAITLMPLLTLAFWINAVFIYNPRPVQALQQLSSLHADRAPRPYQEPLVSVTFDDGWEDMYRTAPKILQNYHMQATFYVLTGTTDQVEYMSDAQIKSLYAAGHEIGSHTIDHKDLATISAGDVQTELAKSKEYLQKLGVLTDTPSLAAPYSSYNSRVLAEITQVYNAHRNTEADLKVVGPEDMNMGPGLKDSDIMGFAVRNSTTDAQIQSALAFAKAHNAWFVLVYHEINNSGSEYSVSAKTFERQMAIVSKSGVRVATVNDVVSTLPKGDR
jgi:peptidoglycan/xylan/chitin deacetylase (PgdA/CDA1 family)